MIVSVTRLRLRSIRYLLPFLIGNERAVKQAKAANGFAGGKLLLDRKLAFWTMTAWSNAATMNTFRASGSHGRVMRVIGEWCDEAAVVHWEHGGELPGWKEAHERLQALGRRTKLANPSAAHLRGDIPAPRTAPAIERTLKSAAAPRAKAAGA